MTSIGNQIILNGISIDAKIKNLDVSQKEASNLVNSRKDGYDTIGAKVEGKDIIILTKETKKILSTDQLKINGQRAEIKFVENEENTKKEFLNTNKYLMAGISFTGVLAGLGTINPKESLIRSVIGVSVATVASGIAVLCSEPKTQDSLTDSISK